MTLRKRLFPVEEVTQRRIEKHLNYLKKQEVPGLEFVINFITDNSNSGLYGESRRAYDSIKSKFYWWEKNINNEMPENSVYFLAHENLKHINSFSFIPRKTASIINFFMFTCMYDFIAIRYFMTTKKELDELDIKNVYLSGLDEQLIFGLDKFDMISDWPQPTAEFFQKLKKIRWENKNTTEFSDRLRVLKVNMTISGFSIPKYAQFNGIEKAVIEIIAGCSAVKNGRDFINKEDVIIGFKTYLKLLNTDITKYKARNTPNSKEHVGEGYLVCDKCHEFYKIQPRESPDDFTDECECRGKLNYYHNIDWLK